MSLVSQRSRRANAGNRMRELLDKEHEREQQRQAVAIAEDVGADADDEDFVEPVDDADVFDSDFDQEEEEAGADEEAVDTELETQLREEEREERRRKKRVHAPLWDAPRKKTTPAKETTLVDAKPSTTIKATSTPPLQSRHSLRTQAILNKQQVEERLRQEELRRAILPKKEKPKPVIISQAERLLEAKQTERDNIAKLEQYLKLEERERQKRKNAWANRRHQIVGPMVRIHSYLASDTKEEDIMPLSDHQHQHSNDNVNDIQQDRLENGTSYVVEMVEHDTEVDVESSQSPTNDISSNTDTDTKAIIQDSDEQEMVTINESTDQLKTHVRVTFSDSHTFNELFQHWDTQPSTSEQTLCVITGLPAKYRDPKTGLPYANTRAFSMLRRLASGTFPWNQDLGAYTNAIDEQAPVTRVHLGSKGIRCVITGQPAIGYEPHTGLPYATEEALDRIKQIKQGTYQWIEDRRLFVSTATASAYTPSHPTRNVCSPAIRDAAVMAHVNAAIEQVEMSNAKVLGISNTINESSIYIDTDSDHWISDD